jgi:hypothetical protein
MDEFVIAHNLVLVKMSSASLKRLSNTGRVDCLNSTAKDF